MITKFGASLDWRFDPESSEGIWEGMGIEYIPPLRALAPKGDTSPRDMTCSVSDPWRLVNQSGHPTVLYAECTDGDVHALEATAKHTLTIDMPRGSYPNFALNLVRSAPPPGQAVPVYVAVTMSAESYDADSDTWVAGDLNLVLPLENEDYGLREPFVHLIAPATPGYGYLTDGEILSRGRTSSAMQQGVSRETWIFEYATNDAYDQDDTLLAQPDGGHLLIRNDNSDDYWHVRSRTLRLVQGADVTVTVCGAIVALNLTPLRYGDATAWPVRYHPLVRCTDGPPDYNVTVEWNTETTWGHVYQPAVGWTVTTTHQIPYGLNRRPLLTFELDKDEYGDPTEEGANYYRPLVWYCTMDIPAVIGEVDGTLDTTEGDGVLTGASWEMDATYRGSRGQAQFRRSDTPLYPAWIVNSKVSLSLGWDGLASAGIRAQTVATAYIPPGGIVRDEDANADALHGLTVEFATFDAVRLERKEIETFRQAGGRTVLDWMTAVANRIGFGGTVSVDPGIADAIIPLAELPSQPNLAPQDGDGWLTHIDEVARACGIRIGFDKDGTGVFFADTGPEEYEHGVSTIAFTLSRATASVEDDIYRIEPSKVMEDFRNRLLIIYGPSRYRQRYVAIESDAERLAGVADDWNRVMVEDDADSPVEAFIKFIRDHYRMQKFVEWVGPLRTDLRPDAFVQINGYDDAHGDCIPDGSVWQIVHVRHRAQQEDAIGDAETTVRAVMVYDGGSTTGGIGYGDD